MTLKHGGLDIFEYSLYVFGVGCGSEMWKDPFVRVFIDAKKHCLNEFSGFFVATLRT